MTNKDMLEVFVCSSYLAYPLAASKSINCPLRKQVLIHCMLSGYIVQACHVNMTCHNAKKNNKTIIWWELDTIGLLHFKPIKCIFMAWQPGYINISFQQKKRNRKSAEVELKFAVRSLISWVIDARSKTSYRQPDMSRDAHASWCLNVFNAHKIRDNQQSEINLTSKHCNLCPRSSQMYHNWETPTKGNNTETTSSCVGAFQK